MFCLLIALGALAVNGSVIGSWLGAGHSKIQGTLFGIALPLPRGLVHVPLFLAAFSGLHFAASAATDQHYRDAFFEPLLDDVRVSLAACQVCLARRGENS